MHLGIEVEGDDGVPTTARHVSRARGGSDRRLERGPSREVSQLTWRGVGPKTSRRCALHPKYAFAQYYTYPMENLMFMMDMEVKKRVLEGWATCMDKTTLQGKYNWIPEGWAMEIRAGWEGNENKMFRFFVHKSSGVLFSSKKDMLAFEKFVKETKIPTERWSFKEDVLLFQELVKKRKASRCATETECDTSSQDNILAQLDFYTWRLSAGWVKETVFRKCSQGVKKDLYFTDPVSHLVFRTKKSAEEYFWTNKNSKDGCSPTLSVTEKYPFDEPEDVSDEECLDGQYDEQEEEKPKAARTSDNEAMTSS